jgi:hypothetical protein
MSWKSHALRVVGSFALVACSSSNNAAAPATNDGGGTSAEASVAGTDAGAKNPDTAPVVSVDRFSDAFAHLFKRSANASLPAANAPIACDQGPFITHGFGPDGEDVTYYNFDVLPTAPASIYAFFAGGTEVAGQLHVIDVLPGDSGYNDFWLVNMVTVPSDYVANSVTSLAEITAAGFPVTPTNMLVNCPVVPAGSTAMLRYTSESSALVRGWYRDQIVNYFSFDERALVATSGGAVPTAPILVTFNIDPSSTNAMSGPPSGFMTEPGTLQTHNVVSFLPASPAYSPLWVVTAYKDSSFAAVSNWATGTQAPVAAADIADVNCPVVAVAQAADGGVEAAATVGVDAAADAAGE